MVSGCPDQSVRDHRTARFWGRARSREDWGQWKPQERERSVALLIDYWRQQTLCSRGMGWEWRRGGLRDRGGCLCARLFSGWMDGCLINNNDGEIKWKYKSVYFLFYNVANIEKVIAKGLQLLYQVFVVIKYTSTYFLSLSLSLWQRPKRNRGLASWII